MDSTVNRSQVVEYYNNRLDYMKDRKQRHDRLFQSLDRLHLAPGRSAVDIGCGTGHTTIYMARQGVEVVGVDIADSLIEYAKKNNSNKNTSYLCADITELDLGKRFDIITMCDVMEHIDPTLHHALMASINRMAHQRTLLFLNIPIQGFTEFGVGRFDHQIIEIALGLGLVLNLFDMAGFVPMSIESTGEGCPFEYYECIFVTKEHAHDVWTHVYDNQASSDEDVPQDEGSEGTLEGEN